MLKTRTLFIILLLFIFLYIITLISHFLNNSTTINAVPSTITSLLKTKILIANNIVSNIHSSDSTIYYLDSICSPSISNDSSTLDRTKVFDTIYDKRMWNQNDNESRSGPGSSLEGAFDWIRHLRSLLQHFHIRSIADIPCGDTNWQFSIRELNTIEQVYFGGDISMNVIEHNQKLYGSTHRNKLFHYWDLVNCPIPTFSYRNSTHKIEKNSFDLIIVRDAIQHMHIHNGLKAVRNVIRSGAKYFALSSYPPNGKSSAPNTRSIIKMETLPKQPLNCAAKKYCQLGAIKEGDVYENNINCYPFNFPLDKAILIQPSHDKFRIESDEIHIYKIDDELKQIVEQYDKACI